MNTNTRMPCESLDLWDRGIERVGKTKKRNSYENEEPSSSKKSRRSSSDTIEFLRQKMNIDRELQLQKENTKKAQIDQKMIASCDVQFQISSKVLLWNSTGESLQCAVTQNFNL